MAMTRPLALFSASFLWTFCLLAFAWHVSLPGIPEYKEPVAEWQEAAKPIFAKWGNETHSEGPARVITAPLDGLRWQK